MSGYSSIFSSGLLATPRPNRSSGDDDSSRMDITPTRKVHLGTGFTTPSCDEDEDMDRDYFNTPSRSRSSSTTSIESSASVANGSIRLRRRRSSLTVSTSPIANIRSPMRSAGVAYQRTMLSPGMGSRARSGSLSGEGGVGSEENIKGRSRSGSLGTALRPRRMVRKAAMSPPPTAPLPALPPLPAMSMTEQGLRRPLIHRSSTSENYLSFGSAIQAHGTYLTTDFASKLHAALTTPPGSNPSSPIDGGHFWQDGAKEN
ncbi:hypothetical protein OF83DRAFT_1083886 [Amylostereum chailletii]|nr:hypothetical protein OF83DRAFT_1083886 [Amylostereum chailletii]